MDSKPVTATKAPNYTQEQMDEMKARYVSNPTRETVNTIAKDFKKAERSIIAKLSNMGIYIPPERVTKSGKPIIKKDEYVTCICKHTGLELTSLIKTNKQDLEKLSNWFNEYLGEL